MAEVISIPFPDISGDVGVYTAFVRTDAGALLNTGGDTIAETGTTGLWTFTLAETRVKCTDYFVRIYSGATEDAANLVYDDTLYAGQTVVGKQFPAPRLFGTVGATSPTTTSFTPSVISPSGAGTNSWKGRILIFDNTTTTVNLRGQATDITAVGAGALPLLTYTALTTAPVSGDTFTIL
jgi:hypothetical protein